MDQQTEVPEATAKVAREAKAAVKDLGTVEIVGRWVWITFPGGKPPEEIRDALKALKFFWHDRRQQWANNCGVWSRPSKYDPRRHYGSQVVTDA